LLALAIHSVFLRLAEIDMHPYADEIELQTPKRRRLIITVRALRLFAWAQ
jgi:hypothetical protein